MNDVPHMIGSAQTKLTRVLAEGDLEAVANHIETGFIPLSVLELSQLCAALCQRLAALEGGKATDG